MCSMKRIDGSSLDTGGGNVGFVPGLYQKHIWFLCGPGGPAIGSNMRKISDLFQGAARKNKYYKYGQTGRKALEWESHGYIFWFQY